jgi:predicted nuclease of restriction endonuclease-like (RecB) superfamily
MILFKKKYRELLDSIGILLQQSRQKAFQQINSILVKTYWEIGRHIVVYEQESKEKAEYGSKLLDRIAKDLKNRFGKGFSRSNVFYFRRFYLAYPKVQTVSGLLSWSHIIALLSVENSLARSFYEKECLVNRWSVRELERQIDSMLFERLALSKDKKGVLKLAEKGQVIEKAEDAVKDPYVITHQDIGQMNLYLNYFKKEEMASDDNEPIGIVLGAEKDHVLVEYALGGISNKLFASKYRLELPDKKLLQKAVEQIVSRETSK